MRLELLLRRVYLVLACSVMTAFAQDASVKHLETESPELYQSFFFFCEEFSKWVDDLGAKEPQRKGEVVRAAAKYLRIRSSEFADLSQISGGVADRVRKSRAALELYLADKSRSRPDGASAELQRFDAERLSAIQDGISGAQRVLSPASWEALRRYINEQHIKHTRVFNKNH